VLDTDLDRYLEYIRSKSTAQQVKKAIRSFPAGKALVVLPSGEQISVQFHPRESKHTGKTPTVRDLLCRLQREAQAVSIPAKTKAPRKLCAPKPQPVLSPDQRIYTALEHDSNLSPMELAACLGCDLEVAKQARHDFFYGQMNLV